MPSPAGLIPRQGGKFVLVGILNNVVGYSLYLLLVRQGLPPLVAMTVSYVVGMVISFTGNRRWTFGHTGSRGSAAVRFMVTNAVAYSVNFAILAVFVEGFGWSHAGVQLAAMAVVAVLTFSLMRLWVFAPGAAVVLAPGPELAGAEEGQLS